MDSFHIKEIAVMREIGINDRDVMRQVRIHSLGEEGEFWKNSPGRGVMLTEAGKERMVESVINHTAAMAAQIFMSKKNAATTLPASQDVSPLSPPSPAIKTPPAPNAEPRYALVTVLRPQFHANRLMVSGRAEDGAMISVRVKDARLFLPRSRTGAFLARWDAQEDRWVFAGRPTVIPALDGGWMFSMPEVPPDPPHCPRFAGRW